MENPDQKTSPGQGEAGNLRTSSSELVRRIDLDRAAGTPGRFARENPNVAGYEGVRLARAALAGDQAALDRFHDLAGLALPGVTEYAEGEAVRLITETVDAVFGGMSCEVPPHHGEARTVFVARNECGHRNTRVDAAELVAWVLSSEGRAALACRSIAVPTTAGEIPAGTLTPEEAVVAARNLGIDLTCGECAAMFYTGHPSSSAPGHPPVHDLLCKTERYSREVVGSTPPLTLGHSPSAPVMETSKEVADHEIDPVTYTDQVWFVKMIRRWLDEDPSKSRWTLTRGQLQGLLSVIDDLSEDE